MTGIIRRVVRAMLGTALADIADLQDRVEALEEA